MITDESGTSNCKEIGRREFQQKGGNLFKHLTARLLSSKMSHMNQVHPKKGVIKNKSDHTQESKKNAGILAQKMPENQLKETRESSPGWPAEYIQIIRLAGKHKNQAIRNTQRIMPLPGCIAGPKNTYHQV